MSTIAASGVLQPDLAQQARRRPRPEPTTSTPASSSRRAIPSRVSMTSSATTTRMGSPLAGWWSPTSSVPPSAPTRSSEVHEPRAARRAVVLDRPRRGGRPPADARRASHVAPRAAASVDGLVDDDSRPSARPRAPRARAAGRRARRGAAPRRRASASAGRQPRLGEDRRIDAVRELAQLLERGFGLVRGRVQHRDELPVVVDPAAPARARRRS